MLSEKTRKLIKEGRNPEKIMVTEAEAADFLGVSVDFIGDLRRAKKISCLIYTSPHRSGRVLIRYRLASLAAYQKRHEQIATSDAA